MCPSTDELGLKGIVARYPAFPPAWRELSSLLTDPAERMAAVEQGLAGDPDPETQGMLLINKALLLRDGDHAAAVAILGSLALDPDSTLGTEALAKHILARMG